MATRNILNVTQVADVDLLIPEIWSRRIYSEFQNNTVMERFTGLEGSNMPIIRKVDLVSGPGDTIHITRINNLAGAGGTGEGQIRGNEEKLVDASISVKPARVWHATGYDWASDHQSIANMREMALSKLGQWWQEKWDDLAWTAANQTAAGGFDATAIEAVYAGGKTSIDTITSTDVFDTDLIDTMMWVLRGNNVKPLIIEGNPYYPLIIHANQAYSLFTNATWRQAQREANIRGSMNPMFTGALGTWNSALLFVTTNSPLANNANSPVVQYAKAIAFGAEALCVGEGSELMWREDPDTYENWYGFNLQMYLKFEIMNHKAIVQGVSAAAGRS